MPHAECACLQFLTVDECACLQFLTDTENMCLRFRHTLSLFFTVMYGIMVDCASVAELAYASDLKSDALTGLWVRVPPEAQTKRCTAVCCVAFLMDVQSYGFQPKVLVETPSSPIFPTIMSRARVLGIISAICAITAATNVILQVPFAGIGFTLAAGMAGLSAGLCSSKSSNKRE